MVGLQALMKVSGCLDKSRLTTGQVGFGLAPRINAAGRLERAMRAVEMLTTDDPVFAASIAEELDLVNGRRQEIEREILREAQEMIRAEGGVKDRSAIVLGRRGWHPGVIGIVASRLVDFYYRPTIVVAFGDDFAQGSARSVPGFNLYEAIRDCSEDLLAFGGHGAAAGLKLTESQFPAFARRFNERCRTSLSVEQLQKSLTIDAEVMLGMLTLPVLEEIARLEPHGVGNPRPLLLASRVRLVGEPRLVGEQKNHVQLRLLQGNAQLKAIGWNMSEKAKELRPNASCSIVFHPSINEWNGRRDVQLELRDLVVDQEQPHA
jgi:single-stranded-DNA-specific exonuclease